MLAHYPLADPQPQAGALLSLGGVKGVEQVRLRLGGNSRSVIGYHEANTTL